MIGGNVPPREIFFFNSYSILGLNQWVKEGTFVD